MPTWKTSKEGFSALAKRARIYLPPSVTMQISMHRYRCTLSANQPCIAYDECRLSGFLTGPGSRTAEIHLSRKYRSIILYMLDTDLVEAIDPSFLS